MEESWRRFIGFRLLVALEDGFYHSQFFDQLRLLVALEDVLTILKISIK
jgi:hypothetical protein